MLEEIEYTYEQGDFVSYKGERHIVVKNYDGIHGRIQQENNANIKLTLCWKDCDCAQTKTDMIEVLKECAVRNIRIREILTVYKKGGFNCL